MSAAEVARRLDEPDFHVFDANWHMLWQKDHVPGARHVAYDSFDEGDLPVDKSATLLFYCHNAL